MSFSLKNIVVRKGLEIHTLLLTPVLSLLIILSPLLFVNKIQYGELLEYNYGPVAGFSVAALLVILGFLLGFIGTRYWWLLGFLIILPLPVITIFEITIYPTEHNLWPIELIFYGFYGLLASLPPFIGSEIARKKIKSR